MCRNAHPTWVLSHDAFLPMIAATIYPFLPLCFCLDPQVLMGVPSTPFPSVLAPKLVSYMDS